MTTIVYKDGVMVGDSMVQMNNMKTQTGQKVFMLDSGVIVGCAGQLNMCQAFVRHLANPDDVPLPPMNQVYAIVVYPDHPTRIYEFEWSNVPCLTVGRYAAAGSGARIADPLLRTTDLSAMEIMEKVAALDVSTCGPFWEERLGEERQHGINWLLKMPFDPVTLRPQCSHSPIHEEEDDE